MIVTTGMAGSSKAEEYSYILWNKYGRFQIIEPIIQVHDNGDDIVTNLSI